MEGLVRNPVENPAENRDKRKTGLAKSPRYAKTRDREAQHQTQFIVKLLEQ